MNRGHLAHIQQGVICAIIANEDRYIGSRKVIVKKALAFLAPERRCARSGVFTSYFALLS